MRMIDADALLNEAEYDNNFRLIIPADKVKKAPALTSMNQWVSVEKVWKGEWEFYDGGCQCKHCGITTKEDSPFCPGCGCAMWNEAVEMVMERLGAQKDADD